jgi:hypothetical protein
MATLDLPFSIIGPRVRSSIHCAPRQNRARARTNTNHDNCAAPRAHAHFLNFLHLRLFLIFTHLSCERGGIFLNRELGRAIAMGPLNTNSTTPPRRAMQ